jgi:hypothetical protein
MQLLASTRASNLYRKQTLRDGQPAVPCAYFPRQMVPNQAPVKHVPLLLVLSEDTSISQPSLKPTRCEPDTASERQLYPVATVSLLGY